MSELMAYLILGQLVTTLSLIKTVITDGFTIPKRPDKASLRMCVLAFVVLAIFWPAVLWDLFFDT